MIDDHDIARLDEIYVRKDDCQDAVSIGCVGIIHVTGAECMAVMVDIRTAVVIAVDAIPVLTAKRT